LSSDVERAEDLRTDRGGLVAALVRRAVRMLAFAALVVVVAAGVLLVLPKTYESTVELLVEPRAAASVGNSAADIDAVIASQIGSLRSHEFLIGIVDSENLRSLPEFSQPAFSPIGLVLRLLGRGGDSRNVDDTVLSNLSDRMRVGRDGSSGVISVAVRSGDPELAAGIANAIARAHVQRRATQSMTDTANATIWLQQEIDKQRVIVREADAAVAAYKIDNDLFVGLASTPVTDQQLSTVTAQIAEAQQRKNAAQSRSQVIRGLLEQGQSLEGLADVQKSVVIQSLLETKANLQGELAQRSTTLLANHPTIRALRAQIRELEGQLVSEAGRVADSLEAEAQVEADLERRLREDLTRAKLLAGSATTGGVDLDSLERVAMAERDLLDSYLARYAEAVSQSAANASADVRVISDAVPASEPASPQMLPTLATIGAAALGLQAAMVVLGELASGRVVIERRREREPEIEDEPAPPVEVDRTDAADIEHAVEQALFEEPAVYSDHDRPDYGDASEDDLDDLIVVEDEGGSDELADDQPEATPLPPADDDKFPDVPLHSHVAQPATEAPGMSQAGRGGDELADLSAAVTTHQLRTVLLSTVGNAAGSVRVVERLLEDTIMAELSAVVIDAGSGDRSAAPGLTDLAAELADYGDVVQRAGENLAEVQWGRLPTLDIRSSRPLTLVEALADIYHIVIVDTGEAGMGSSLPLFTGARATVVLVADGEANQVAIGQARREIAALGFEVGRVVTLPMRRADVA
jgi:succinoglycan biosynthesis transport protein ExoP